MLGALSQARFKEGSVITVPDVVAEKVAKPEVAALMLVVATPDEFVVAEVVKLLGVIAPTSAT
jgi:hypothetical protein